MPVIFNGKRNFGFVLITEIYTEKMFWARTERIGYFRAPKTLTFKTRLSAEPFL